jgi:hypothetical protein
MPYQRKKQNMKTKVLLLGAVVTAFALTSFAAEPLLSPRAKDNQIKIVTSSIDTQGGTVTYVTSVSPALLSPRAQANQIKVVKGTNNDINPATVCQKIMSGSPKAVAECSSHTTMPGCVTVAPLK